MSWIEVPATLYSDKAVTSDASHVTSIYTQLTDGTREFIANTIVCKDFICNSFTGCVSDMFKLVLLPIDSTIIGNYSQNIDYILKSQEYHPDKYQNKILNFVGINYSYAYNNFSATVQSLKNQYNVWEWNLVGIYQWN